MTPEQHKRLGATISRLPQGRWEVWTSNSFRRITARGLDGRTGVDGGVLHGNTQRDGHPDLSMTADELQALCDMRNLVAEILGTDPCRHDPKKASKHPDGGFVARCAKCNEELRVL